MGSRTGSRTRLALGAAVAALCAAGQAQAAGFALKSHSASGQGASFAGASAGANGVASMFFNPASIALADHMQTEAGGAILLPNVEISNVESAFVAGVNPTTGALIYTPQSNGPTSSTSDSVGLVPHTYVAAPINDRVTVGLSVNAPFGLSTDYGDAWAGRYHATASELTTINAAPTVAYDVTDKIAVAAGLQLQYAKAELESAVSLPAAICSVSSCGALAGAIGNSDFDALSKVKGHDFAVGFTLGVIAEPLPGTRVGVGYRSKIKHDIDGEAEFHARNAMGAPYLSAVQALGRLTDGGGTTSISTPAMLNFGVSHQLTDRVKLLGEAQWTQWSSFEDLVIDFDDNTPSSVTEHHWDDSWYFALGAEYQATPELRLRAGLGFDQTPVPTKYRTPRLPDTDRTWFSLGASYDVNDKISVNAGYTYIVAKDAKIDLAGTGTDGSRGKFSGDLDANVHIFMLSGLYRF